MYSRKIGIQRFRPCGSCYTRVVFRESGLQRLNTVRFEPKNVTSSIRSITPISEIKQKVPRRFEGAGIVWVAVTWIIKSSARCSEWDPY